MYWLRLISLLLITQLGWPGGVAKAFDLHHATVRTGPVFDDNEPNGVQGVSFATAFTRQSPTPLNDIIYYEAEAGWMREPGLPDSLVRFGRVSVMWHHAFSTFPQRWFFELGSGATLRSRSRIKDKEQGGKFHFTPQLKVGTWLGTGFDPRGRFAFTVQHSSNGGIVRPNPGINMILIEFGYRFIVP